MSELLLMCIIGGHRAAIPAIRVQSVIEIEEITPIPGVPSFILGLTALRSQALTVIDCSAALGFESCGDITGRRAAVVDVEGDDPRLALLVQARGMHEDGDRGHVRVRGCSVLEDVGRLGPLIDGGLVGIALQHGRRGGGAGQERLIRGAADPREFFGNRDHLGWWRGFFFWCDKCPRRWDARGASAVRWVCLEVSSAISRGYETT